MKTTTTRALSTRPGRSAATALALALLACSGSPTSPPPTATSVVNYLAVRGAPATIATVLRGSLPPASTGAMVNLVIDTSAGDGGSLGLTFAADYLQSGTYWIGVEGAEDYFELALGYGCKGAPVARIDLHRNPPARAFTLVVEQVNPDLTAGPALRVPIHVGPSADPRRPPDASGRWTLAGQRCQARSCCPLDDGTLVLAGMDGTLSGSFSGIADGCNAGALLDGTAEGTIATDGHVTLKFLVPATGEGWSFDGLFGHDAFEGQFATLDRTAGGCLAARR